MTDEELEAFGKQIWKLGRSTTDPILKIMCEMIHKNVVVLRKHGDMHIFYCELYDLMIKNLRGLQRHLGKPRVFK
jgi:hypothetical protein